MLHTIFSTSNKKDSAGAKSKRRKKKREGEWENECGMEQAVNISKGNNDGVRSECEGLFLNASYQGAFITPGTGERERERPSEREMEGEGGR